MDTGSNQGARALAQCLCASKKRGGGIFKVPRKGTMPMPLHRKRNAKQNLAGAYAFAVHPYPTQKLDT